MKSKFSVMKKHLVYTVLVICSLNCIGNSFGLAVEKLKISASESNGDVSFSINDAGNEVVLNKIQDIDLVLNCLTIDSKRILRVSFNGNEGSSGTLKIFNSSRELVKEENFELIKDPFYASVDITDLLSGTYRVELITKKGIHTSILTVK